MQLTPCYPGVLKACNQWRPGLLVDGALRCHGFYCSAHVEGGAWTEVFCDRHGIDTRCHVQHVGERIG